MAKDPALQRELERFAEVVQGPVPESARPEPTPHQEGRAPNLRNLNPNQFALPGMEHLAHPGARHLPKGISFTHHEERGVFSPLGGGSSYHSHYLYAHKEPPGQFDPERHHGNALGWIQWAGEAAATRQGGGVHYPGEIEYVERGFGEERPPKGLMSDLYRMGHHLQMGQTTVPVHSPTRTPEGEEWSRKVGGLRPTSGDYEWRPPHGIHPFEHEQAAEELEKRRERATPYVKGQQELHLPGTKQIKKREVAPGVWRYGD